MTTDHYNDDGDSPAWTSTATSWTRNITGPDGNLAATADQAGTVDPAAGQPARRHRRHRRRHQHRHRGHQLQRNHRIRHTPHRQPPPGTYGWLGGKQRSNNDLAGLTLMGARLYNPTTGRFLSTDPIPGGNPNAYTYPLDPVNETDIGGMCLEDACVGEGAGVWFAGAAAAGAIGWLWHGGHGYHITLPTIHISWFAHKKKTPSRNAEREGHQSGARGSTSDRHTKAQSFGGRQKPNYTPNQNKRKNTNFNWGGAFAWWGIR